MHFKQSFLFFNLQNFQKPASICLMSCVILGNIGSIMSITANAQTSAVSSSNQANSNGSETTSSQTSNQNEISASGQDCKLNQFKAEYFEISTKNTINIQWRNNDLFSTSPVVNKCEDKIDYDWGRDKKADEKLALDYFAARWSGEFLFENGEYEFSLLGDDDIRLFVDDKKIVTATWSNRQDWQTAKLNLNGNHKLKVEYKEGAKDAYAKLKWAKVSSNNPESAGPADYCRYKWCPIPLPEARIDQELISHLKNSKDEEEVTFVALLKDQADLSEAYKITDKTEQGNFAYKKLTETASQSQGNLKNKIAEWQKTDTNLQFRDYYLVNAVGIKTTVAKARQYIAEIGQNHPEVRYLERLGDIEMYNYEYGTDRIEADLVHTTGNTGQNVTVGVIDSGVRSTHQDLSVNYRGTITGSHDYNWYDTTGISPAPTDCDDHGTHVAGTIASTALTASPNPNGTAPGVNWIASNSICSGDFLIVLDSMQFMFAPIPVGGDLNTQGDPSRRPDLVNNSWGGRGGNTILYGMISNWRAVNIIPVFAAGNSGPGVATLGSPGDFDISFTVGATDQNNQIADFSSRGNSELFPASVKPNVSAPGVDVRSTLGTVADNSYGTMSGTSMASPHVSGCAALVKSANPGWNVAQIENKLMATAQDLGIPGADMEYGYGLVNCSAAATNEALNPISTNSVGDFVWVDNNDNGLQDEGEIGASGVSVSLIDSTTSAVLATTTTNLNGYYQFINLVPGNTYELSFAPPNNLDPVTPDVNNNGNDYQDSDILATNSNGRLNSTNSFAYDPSTSYFFDAGFRSAPRISGYFFRDNNASHRGFSATSFFGMLFGGDTPETNLPVFLHEFDPVTGQRTDTGQVQVTGSTAVYGGFVPGYSFENLDENKQYVLSTFVPAGMILSNKDVVINDAWTTPNSADYYDSDFNATSVFTDPIIPTRLSVNTLNTDAPGAKANGVSAGFIPANASINGNVFNDLNQNGLQDAGDTPRAGVQVSLLNYPQNTLESRPNVNFVNPAVTDANGNYSFTSVYPGQSYTLRFEGLAANEDFTTIDAAGEIGIAGNLDSDVNSRNSAAFAGSTIDFVLQANEQNTNIDAGIISVVNQVPFAWGGMALGNGTSAFAPSPIRTLNDYNSVIQIDAGGNSGIALTRDRKVLVWKEASSCSSETSGRIDFITNTPQEFDIPGAIKVVSSGENQYILLNDGTVLASGSGIGMGLNTVDCQAGDARGLVQLGLNNIKDISPNGSTFLTNDNRVLTREYSTNSFIEKFGPNDNVVAISDYTAIKSDGTVWIWGHNHIGQFGNGTTTGYQETPVQANLPAGVQITSVSHGGNHVLALDSTGRVWAWGENYHGQLGNNRSAIDYAAGFYTAFESTPVLVQGLENVIAIAASGVGDDQTPYWSWGYSVALTANRSVWTWGSDTTNGSPTLGNGGENVDTKLPTQIPNFSNIQQISAGGQLVLALAGEGL